MRTLVDICNDLDTLLKELRSQPLPPILVQPGDNVQAAIDAAPWGSVLTFVPGERYVTGTLKLPNPITLRSACPLPNRRITPADAPLLPTFASGGPYATIDGTNAYGVALDGIAFESRQDGAGEIIIWQDAHYVAMDRLLIVAGAKGQKRAVRGNGQNITLTRSHIANVWAPGQDSQAFCAWDGAGPYTITDNYLEAASENVMFGGADSQSAERIPADILIEGNYFSKRLEWKPTPPATISGKVVKNLLELKSAKRTTIRGNTFERNWKDAQDGYALSFKSVNQNGTAPWSVVEDVLFENNIVRDVGNGINIQGETFEKNADGSTQHGGRTTGIVIRGNDIQTTGVAVQITGGPGAITLDRTSFVNGWTFLQLAGNPIGALTVTNVLANHSTYGVKGDGTGAGLPSLTKFAPGFVWTDNALLNPPTPRPSYPSTTYFDLASVPIGVTVGK